MDSFSHYFAFLIFAFLGSACQVDKAEDIILKSIEAHGGMELYQSIDTLQFEKEIISIHQKGDTISQVKQDHTYILDDQIEGEISWVIDSLFHQIINKRGVVQKKVNGKVIQDESDVALSTFLSGTFTVLQPFVLNNNSIDLVYKGKQILLNNIDTEVVEAFFPANESGHQESWTYFFDAKSYLLTGMMVYYNESYSLIMNETYIDSGGVLWHGKRKSYKVDQDLKVEYLRAAYDYRNYHTSQSN